MAAIQESKTEQQKALEYLNKYDIGSVLQSGLNKLYLTQPSSVFGYLSDYLENHSENPTIALVAGYVVKSLHSSEDRVQIQVSYKIRNHIEYGEPVVCGHYPGDIMSTNDLKVINDSLTGYCLYDQEKIDRTLSEIEGLSVSTRLTVSLAVFKTACKALDMPPMERLVSLLEAEKPTVPLPIVTLFIGGKSCNGKNNIGSIGICCDPAVPYEIAMTTLSSIYDKVEEILRKKAIPTLSITGSFVCAADKVEILLDMTKEAMSELQVEIEVNFVIDFKAQNFHSEASLTTGSAKKGQVSGKKKRSKPSGSVQPTSKHRYEWIESQIKQTDDFCDFIENLVDNEAIKIILNPLHPEDIEGYNRLVKSLGERCHVMSSTPIVACKTVNSTISFSDTISSTLDSIKSNESNFRMLVPCPVEEGDSLLADLALASSAQLISFGGLRGVSQLLYNRLFWNLQRTQTSTNTLSDWQFMAPPPETPLTDQVPEGEKLQKGDDLNL